MEGFTLEKIGQLRWKVTENATGTGVEFLESAYNGHQKVISSDGNPDSVAASLKRIGDYMVRCHGDIAFPQKYGWKIDENDGTRILYSRGQDDRWELRLDGYCRLDKLPESLRKAAEFAEKGFR